MEWAIATRVQGDKDVMIVSNARAKPLDPSLPQGYGVVPTGAKVGIDATIPEGIPREYYERITYAYADTRQDRRLRQRQDGRGRDMPATISRWPRWRRRSWRRSGKEPLYYTDIAERFSAYNFRTVARALGHLHATEKLWQDPRGRMCVRGSEFAAKPPQRHWCTRRHGFDATSIGTRRISAFMALPLTMICAASVKLPGGSLPEVELEAFVGPEGNLAREHHAAFAVGHDDNDIPEPSA